eukprot:15347318-Ditylum_brightwellii.AAC.1
MSTPHVSGAALLLWNSYPTCSAHEIRDALEQGAEDFGAVGRDDYYGNGILRYWASEQYLMDTYACGFKNPKPLIVCNGPVVDHEGATGQSVVCSVSSSLNYTGTANLSCPDSPQGVTCSAITPSQITLTAGATSSVTVGISVGTNQEVGSYPLKIRAEDTTDNTLAHISTISVEVIPAFDVACTPNLLSIREGGPEEVVSCTVSSNEGFSGPIVFSCPPDGALTCSLFSTPTATLVAGGS